MGPRKGSGYPIDGSVGGVGAAVLDVREPALVVTDLQAEVLWEMPTQEGQASETGGSVPHAPEGQPKDLHRPRNSAPSVTASVLSDGAIAAVARNEAEKAGDELPTITAVDTTLQRAIETNPAGKAPANPVTEAMMKSKVVLVTMYGHFQLNRARLPLGDQKSLLALRLHWLSMLTRGGWTTVNYQNSPRLA
jgi:hypothetical protein